MSDKTPFQPGREDGYLDPVQVLVPNNNKGVEIVKKIQGRIVRKKKRSSDLVLSLALDPCCEKKESGRDANVIIHVEQSSELQNICFLGAKICATGSISSSTTTLDDDESSNAGVVVVRASEIHLVRCAPDPNAVEFVLSAFSAEIIMSGSMEETDESSSQEIQDVIYRNGNVTISIPPTCLGERIMAAAAAAGVEELGQTHTLTHTLTLLLVKKKGRDRRLAIAKQVRALGGATKIEKAPRQRTPRTKKTDLEMLERLETNADADGWTLYSIPEPIHFGLEQQQQQEEEASPEEDTASILNIPDNDPGQVSARGNMTRGDYIHGRKWPQVRWMVARLKQLEFQQARGDINFKYRHILDVGGGRGDLGVAIAAEFPSAQITVVDKNKQSLEAGKEYSQRVGCSQAMDFVEADFLTFVETDADLSSTSPRVDVAIDVVVGLHACGDLTDLILEYARRRNIPFVVCPCCFNKRWLASSGFTPRWYQVCQDTNDISSLQRLAESEVRPVSFRAMKIINSMRMSSQPKPQPKPKQPSQEQDANAPVDNSGNIIGNNNNSHSQPTAVSLEQYPSDYSLRNIVLISEGPKS
jgi:hypothetical protein